MTDAAACDSIIPPNPSGGCVMRAFLLGLAAVGICISPVSAATTIEAKPGKPWKHKATGAALPASLAGLPRTKVVYLTSPEVDVAANYENADGSEAVTIYIYRDVSGSVPVWFDKVWYRDLHRRPCVHATRAQGRQRTDRQLFRNERSQDDRFDDLPLQRFLRENAG